MNKVVEDAFKELRDTTRNLTVHDYHKKLEIIELEIKRLESVNKAQKLIVQEAINIRDNIRPCIVYHSKKRNNTTIKFADGSSITVKKQKGEVDCLETAVAYALVKQVYGKSYLERLVKDIKEV